MGTRHQTIDLNNFLHLPSTWQLLSTKKTYFCTRVSTKIKWFMKAYFLSFNFNYNIQRNNAWLGNDVPANTARPRFYRSFLKFLPSLHTNFQKSQIYLKTSCNYASFEPLHITEQINLQTFWGLLTENSPFLAILALRNP